MKRVLLFAMLAVPCVSRAADQGKFTCVETKSESGDLMPGIEITGNLPGPDCVPYAECIHLTLSQGVNRFLLMVRALRTFFKTLVSLSLILITLVINLM